jgi:hypothetical protein
LRVQPFTGINMAKTFGFPTYMDEQLPLLHGIANETSVPSFTIGNYTPLAGQPGSNNSKIFSIDDDGLHHLAIEPAEADSVRASAVVLNLD